MAGRDAEPTTIRIREYGSAGSFVVLLHGGPGAPGSMASVARALEDSFRIVEPFQRRSGTEPLTVSRHVADLHEVILRLGDSPPALVGHSWGAMLALAYAAAHPGRAAALVLVGCGTFDGAARERMRARRDSRIDDALRRRLDRLTEEFPDPDERLGILGQLMLSVDSCEPIVQGLDLETCDARGYRETWDDMLRLQAEGVYPSAFAAIQAPVLMLHGSVDPHPGRLIRASLAPSLPQVEYLEWERCGHYPWLERAVRDEFFFVVRRWLARRLAADPENS